MTSQEIKRRIWWNSLSNYFAVGLRLAFGVVMFRLLFGYLSAEHFGFWALLWSVFGYGILLDFGFGFTAQKRVAELSVTQNWEALSRVLSTIFFTYVAVAGVIVLASVFGSNTLIDLFNVTPQNRAEFRRALAVFLCGVGLAFPMGLFPELLKGQQRILLANVIFSVGMAANFALVLAAIYWGWSLQTLLLIALGCVLVPDFACGVFALRQMPGVRLRPGLFSFGMMRETMSFSLFAYLATLSTIVLTKTDQLVISATLTVAAVALYQAGAKVAEMFAGISLQLPDTFSPTAAHLYAKGDRHSLRKLLVDGARFSVMVATPLFIISFVFMEELLRLLTGQKIVPGETYWTGQILLIWCYILVATQGVAKRVFIMCGHEKKVMYLGLGEAVLNLGLSVALVTAWKSVIAVAVGSLVASAVFGFFFVWPWVAREANLSILSLTRAAVLPSWVACSPVIALALAERLMPWGQLHDGVAGLILGGAVAAVAAGAGLWFAALTAGERARVSALLGRYCRREKAA